MSRYAVQISIGVAVVGALAIGALLMMNRGDGTAQASPQSRSGSAEPQGAVTDSGFQCVAYAVTRLANSMNVDVVTCHSDFGQDNSCTANQAQTITECSDGTFVSTCTQVTGEEQWECEDTGGGSHFCGFLEFTFFCESTGPGRDFIDCFQEGETAAFSCGTVDGPLVCLQTFDDVEPGVSCTVIGGAFSNTQGDLDCDGEISSRDNQALLRNVLGGTALSQEPECVNVGDLFYFFPTRVY